MGLTVQDRTFLDALDTEARKDLFRLGAERAFRPDEHLLTEQDDSSHVLVLLEGWAVVSTATDRSSARLILALRRRGELLGEMAALGGIARSATVTALGPVRALVVTGVRFRAFAGRDPQVGALLMAQLVARLRTADEERRALASLTVLQRVAARLLELGELQSFPGTEEGRTGVHGNAPAREARGGVPGARAGGPGGAGRTGAHADGGTGPAADGSPVLAQLAQHDLADAVGATREAVAKSLRLLRAAGVVRTRPRRIELVDRDALRLLAAGGDIGFPAR
ncbi:Crp/Fnr family transcriptional regulator [Streptomyces sp. enrichment culture]|uniref:Crp/Fnr family transcriptional regulator n=1 Tax=Streptomyces sp. enrichment culture TaxID=1795815 RepID=UPI003F56FCB7